jgi:proline iminopeptidase
MRPDALGSQAQAPTRAPAWYPPIEAYRTEVLPVSGGHRLHVEEAGNAAGVPALFVHGGPGSNVSPGHRRFFDPAHYRIVLFDQRGAGKSEPSGSTLDNTTWHLVEDIESLRRHLGVERWLLFGGSWGSTLSLAYAIAHPERVLALVLRGIFLVSASELHWFYQEGASRIFPEEFELYAGIVPLAERHDLIAAYHRRLHGDDAQVCLRFARAWCRWEAACSFLVPREDYAKKFEDDRLTLAFARIESHYFAHLGFFATATQLLDGVDRIRAIPARIVQGRYDMVCPMETAWALHRAWPEADFRIVPMAGHSALEDDTVAELVAATDEFRRLGSGPGA